ncbi:hypothetical protein F4821DRAFT_100219 [Hypoxylon rubiginosum]|uniref:Uncharacterized protein n=1 Tax=Hypoxylon rubiginosum TaxID=110542 RepID=A0ACC0D5H3_9PEZI|nr:hypothetical protein F4821DRAFT_100219 [Hypoxylon rubiginosum]
MAHKKTISCLPSLLVSPTVINPSICTISTLSADFFWSGGLLLLSTILHSVLPTSHVAITTTFRRAKQSSCLPTLSVVRLLECLPRAITDMSLSNGHV